MILTLLHSERPKLHTLWSFGRSECNRVKEKESRDEPQNMEVHGYMPCFPLIFTQEGNISYFPYTSQDDDARPN